MSAAVTPARRLLALLDEEPSLETRPRDEIDADLAILGIDPAGPVRLARRLAARSSGPAAALLGAMIEDESAEAEIAALESADIADIRSRLQPGTVAALTAEAQRRAGRQSNVVGISRPRRGAVWAWTGSLVGMAACALIVVAVWWPPSELHPSSDIPAAVVSAPALVERRAASSESAPQLADSSALSNAAPPRALGVVPPAAETEPAAMDAAAEMSPAQSPATAPPSDQERFDSMRSDEVDDVPVSRLAAVPRTATPPLAGARLEPADPIVEKLVEQEPDAPGVDSAAAAASRAPAPIDGRLANAPPLPPPTPAERRSLAGSLAVGEAAAPGAADYGEDSVAGGPSSLPSAAPSQDPASASAENSRARAADLTQQPRGLSVWAEPVRVIDVLIVDPNSADIEAIVMPGAEALQFDAGRAATDRSAGDLSDRLGVARRAADGQAIVALLALQSAGARFDAVLVRREAGSPAMAGDPTRPLLTRWFGDGAAGFALIVLAPGP